jgi:hypothetical protein
MHRHIVLADMHSISPQRQRHVDPVIDHKGQAVEAAQFLHGSAPIHQFAGGALFSPHLHHRGSPCGDFLQTAAQVPASHSHRVNQHMQT